MKIMKRNHRSLISLCFSFFLLLGLPWRICAQVADMDLQIRGKILSADLDRSAIKEVIEKLGSEKAIWFKGVEHLVDD